MELLGLSEDELCRVLDVDPLTLLSGQLEHRAELPILLDLLARPPSGRAGGAAALGAGVGPAGRPIDALLAATSARSRTRWPSSRTRGSCSRRRGDG